MKEVQSKLEALYTEKKLPVQKRRLIEHSRGPEGKVLI